MSWYTINDPRCQFKKEGPNFFGKINGIEYKLTDHGFVPTGVSRNPYLPDEITDQFYAHARMLPHHLAYAKAKARDIKLPLKRNAPFIPAEVKNVFTTHAKMLPHHLAYARGVVQSKFGKHDFED